MEKPFDSMLFDLDGTLWDSVKSVTDAWNEGLKNQLDVSSPLTEADIRGIMGLNTKEIGDRLFSSLAESRRAELMVLCGDAERQSLPKTGGTLYPDTENTLRRLKLKLPLFIVSNCDAGYIEAFLSYHKLGDCFLDYLCYGDTGKDKAANIRALVDRYQLKAPVYIGDTEKDRLAAKSAKTSFIHAAYGFGSIGEKSRSISAISALLTYL